MSSSQSPQKRSAPQPPDNVLWDWLSQKKPNIWHQPDNDAVTHALLSQINRVPFFKNINLHPKNKYPLQMSIGKFRQGKCILDDSSIGSLFIVHSGYCSELMVPDLYLGGTEDGEKLLELAASALSEGTNKDDYVKCLPCDGNGCPLCEEKGSFALKFSVSDILVSNDVFGEFALWDWIQSGKKPEKTRLYHVFAGLPFKKANEDEHPVIIRLDLQECIGKIKGNLNWINSISELMHEKSFTKSLLLYGRAELPTYGMVLAALWLGFNGHIPVSSYKGLGQQNECKTGNGMRRPKELLTEFSTDARVLREIVYSERMPSLTKWEYPRSLKNWLKVEFGKEYSFNARADVKDEADFKTKLDLILEMLLTYSKDIIRPVETKLTHKSGK